MSVCMRAKADTSTTMVTVCCMQVRRLMEEDNSKRRKAARREFQDNVRALVAFVRKRDLRVIAWMEQEERKKVEREAADLRRYELLRSTQYGLLQRSPGFP